jgi:hypothetical protein
MWRAMPGRSESGGTATVAHLSRLTTLTDCVVRVDGVVATHTDKESVNTDSRAIGNVDPVISPGWNDPEPVLDRPIMDTSAQKSARQNAKPVAPPSARHFLGNLRFRILRRINRA